MTQTTYSEVSEAMYQDFKKANGFDNDVWFEFDQQIIRHLYIDNEFYPMKLELKTLKYKDVMK